MTVYVDSMMSCRKNQKWPWTESCHLFADNERELHTFAAVLGLKREWHKTGDFSHYDLTGRMRAIAVTLGAREVDRRFFTEFFRGRIARDRGQCDLLKSERN